MSDLPPSEHGGKTMRNGVQPFPHEPTASEKLSLAYRTGDESGALNPDEGETFTGFLPLVEQVRIRTDEGVLERGQLDPRKADS